MGDEYESPHAVEIGFRKKAVTVTRSEVAAGAEYEPSNKREIGFRKNTETAKRTQAAEDDGWEPPSKREIGFKRKIETTKSAEDLTHNKTAVRAGLMWARDADMDGTTEVSRTAKRSQSLGSKRDRLDAGAGHTTRAADDENVYEAPNEREIGFRRRTG